MAKKVLFVVTKSNFGGAQRYVYDLATHLTSDFEPVVVFGHGESGKAGRLSRMLIEKNVHTLVVPELQRDMHFSKDWRAFQTLVALIKDEKPEIVHLNSSKAAGLGALAARIAGVPRIIFTIHGLPADENRSFLQRTAIVLLTWITALLSHRVITISNEAYERVRNQPFLYKKTVLIYNGIEPPEFLSSTDAVREIRTIDPSIPEKALVGMVGELHPNKDIASAIDALEHLHGAHLVILGDGECREALRMHAQSVNVHDRVHFLGYIPDAAKYLRAFNAFLLTSRKEGLPYVLLEASAAHVPICAVDIPGVRDVILHEFTGLLVPREAKSIADGLSRLLHGEALVHSLTDEMGTRIQKTFSLHSMVEKTLGLYY